VATALRFARLLRRLASSREDPLDNAANASALLSGFGVGSMATGSGSGGANS
jgi:hypothetical protein